MNVFDTRNPQRLLNEPDREMCSVRMRLQLLQRVGNPPVDWSGWIFRQLKKKPRSRVLELGCGSGLLWQDNREKLPLDWAMTLADCSFEQLQEAQRYLGHCNRQFAFQLLNAPVLPFEDACFDLLLAHFHLPQVPNLFRAFSEIQRVLRTDGLFYATTISQNAFAPLNALLEAVGLPSWENTAVFSMENGADQLSRWFTEVALHRLTQILVMREGEPLLRCLRAGISPGQYHEALFQRLGEHIEQELSRHGEIVLPLDIGLFEATKRTA